MGWAEVQEAPQASIRSWITSGSSPGRTSDSALILCLTAFMDAILRSASVLGPVDLSEFWRLIARRCSGERGMDATPGLRSGGGWSDGLRSGRSSCEDREARRDRARTARRSRVRDV